MPTRIETKFKYLQRRNAKAFIAYITAGDPSLKITGDDVLRLEDAGVDIVELGIPFSDPLADGRVNQESAERALRAGATPGKVIDTVQRIRARTEIPVVLYAYLNLLVARGFEKTLKRMGSLGVDGVLILDLPVEEMKEYTIGFRESSLNNIRLVTPTSSNERIKKIVQCGDGFVYCVSREGVTGMQKSLAQGALSLVRRTKSFTQLPVALGFGISSPEQARSAASAADGVVVGSAIVQRLHEAGKSGKDRQKVMMWVKRLVRATKEV